MPKIKKLLSTLIALSLITSACGMNTYAAPTCREVIEAADEAIAAKSRALAHCTETSEALQQELFRQQQEAADARKRAQEAEERASKWYHNPLVLIPLGIVGGLILGQVFGPAAIVIPK